MLQYAQKDIAIEMSSKINVYTRNQKKVEEIKRLLPAVELVSCDLEVEEIQSLDPVEVAVAKAKQAYEKSQKQAGIIEDVSLNINYLNGLPGTYIDAFMKTLGNDGILKILRGAKDRGAEALIIVVYTDEKGDMHIFDGRVKGRISDKVLGEGFGWDPIFIPEGDDQTFAQMTPEQKDKFSMRAIAFRKLGLWLQGLDG